MKKKIQFTKIRFAALLLGLSSLCLLSCDSDAIGEPENRVPVQFSTGGSVATPQSSGANTASLPQPRGANLDLDNPYWQDLDSIGIIMIPPGNRTSPIIYNRLYVTRLSPGIHTEATFQPDRGNHIYLPAGQDVEFIAYFPYKPHVNYFYINLDLDRYSVSHDLRVTEPMKVDRNNPNVKLKFKHMFSRITVEMTGDGVSDSELSGLVVRVMDTPNTAVFNLKANTITQYNNRAIPMRGAGKNRSSIVFPTEPALKATTRRIDFVIGYNVETFSYYFPQDLNFEQGKEYNFKITVSRQGVTASSMTVAEWTTTDVPSSPPVVIP